MAKVSECVYTMCSHVAICNDTHAHNDMDVSGEIGNTQCVFIHIRVYTYTDTYMCSLTFPNP